MNLRDIIICVDDEKEILEVLQRQLSIMFGASYDLEFAESGEEALELIAEIHQESDANVRLVISDWLMPGIRGDELLKEIRSTWPHIKKILLTGHAPSETIHELEREGISRCMNKPWDQRALGKLISGLLN